MPPGDSHAKGAGMLHVSFGGMNFRFCSRRNTNIFTQIKLKVYDNAFKIIR